MAKCLRVDCEREAHTRGLCRLDYQLAVKLVKRGLTTWASLEAQGKALPSARGSGVRARTARAWLLAPAPPAPLLLDDVTPQSGEKWPAMEHGSSFGSDL